MNDERAAHFEAILEGYRIKFDNDDKSALSDAIKCCVMFRLDMPEWVCMHLLDSLGKHQKLEVKTLDEAFGFKQKTDKKIIQERKWQEKCGNVALAFFKALKDKANINDDLADTIAEDFGINRREAWVMYKDFRENTSMGRALYKAFQTTKNSKKTKKINLGNLDFIVTHRKVNKKVSNFCFFLVSLVTDFFKHNEF